MKLKSTYQLIDLNDLIKDDLKEIKAILNQNGIVKFDKNDINSILKLIKNLNPHNLKDYNLSYIIKRMDKELDVVKIDKNTIINIEMKKKIKDTQQCIDNYKIFSKFYPNHQIYIYCYTAESNTIHILDPNQNLLKLSNFTELNSKLDLIPKGDLLEINFEVQPVYKDSPFFLNDNYFLSNSQKTTKRNIKKSQAKTIVVKGRAGVGKSLLALDLYKEYLSQKNTVYLCPFKKDDIIDIKLRDKYLIQTVRDFRTTKMMFDCIIVDEAQRLSALDIEELEKRCQQLILFGDLFQNIDGENALKKYIDIKKDIDIFNMHQIIRTDDTFETFAREILNMPKTSKKSDFDPTKIKIKYPKEVTSTEIKTHVYLTQVVKGDSKCDINCPNKYCEYYCEHCPKFLTTYDVISLEYPKTLLYLCQSYYLKDNEIYGNESVFRGDLKGNLYSLITRTVDELIVVVDNEDLYNYLQTKIKALNPK